MNKCAFCGGVGGFHKSQCPKHGEIIEIDDDGNPVEEQFDTRNNAERERDAAVEELTEAIRFTAEYLGVGILPPIHGWSWYDALVKYAPEKAAVFKAEFDKRYPDWEKELGVSI